MDKNLVGHCSVLDLYWPWCTKFTFEMGLETVTNWWYGYDDKGQ